MFISLWNSDFLLEGGTLDFLKHLASHTILFLDVNFKNLW